MVLHGQWLPYSRQPLSSWGTNSLEAILKVSWTTIFIKKTDCVIHLQAKQEQGSILHVPTRRPLDYQNVLQMQQENGPTDNPTDEWASFCNKWILFYQEIQL